MSSCNKILIIFIITFIFASIVISIWKKENVWYNLRLYFVFPMFISVIMYFIYKLLDFTSNKRSVKEE